MPTDWDKRQKGLLAIELAGDGYAETQRAERAPAIGVASMDVFDRIVALVRTEVNGRLQVRADKFQADIISFFAILTTSVPHMAQQIDLLNRTPQHTRDGPVPVLTASRRFDLLTEKSERTAVSDMHVASPCCSIAQTWWSRPDPAASRSVAWMSGQVLPRSHRSARPFLKGQNFRVPRPSSSTSGNKWLKVAQFGQASD